MTWDPGIDFEAPAELRPDMRLLDRDLNEKARGFLNCIARALAMPRGGLWFAPNFGTPLTDFICDGADPRVAQQQINAECLKDERCSRAETTIVVSGDRGEVWQIKTLVYSQDGKVYQLVFLATAERATLLLSGVA